MNFETRKKLGHYEICQKIGAGGMGEVYLAKDTELERLVTLKILPAEFSNSDERVRRFVQEAKAASALNHPNILTVYEIGNADGSRFIAAEYIKGETLRERLRSTPPDLRETLDISLQVAAALNAAHSSGIIHRDIKPENLMIRTDGIVKVLDFGLAKLTENKSEALDTEGETRAQEVNTIAGMILGTAAYMSPEQARGQKVDARSDIFNFGVCLYEMLAGFNPFQSETTADVLAAVLQRDPAPLSVLKPDVPEELSRIVAKTLHKNRDERFQTSENLLRDLKQFQQRLSVGAILKSSRTSIFQSKETINSLAILPLGCDGDDAQTEYLSDGITESIINALAQISGLNVVPRNTVFRFKGSQRDAQAIGRQLNVQTLLTGRVRQYGENLIIGVELIDVGKDTQIWGEQYRRPLTDIFELQEEIAADISKKLRLKLTGEEKKRLAKRYTENAEAYQFYLKGRYFVTTKRTEEWIKKGIEYFQQAIELDPTYALAFAGLADAYAFLASSTGGWSPHEGYPKAKAAAERALAIDETLGEAHASLGFFHVLYDWNFPAAEREFQRAIELSPNYPTAHDGYGFYLKAMGRHEEAIEECRSVQELDPLSPFAHVSLGWAYYFARTYERAIEECKNALEIEQNSTFAYRILGFAYLQQGKFDEALAALRKAVTVSSGGLAFEAHLGYACAAAGKKTEAVQVLKDLEAIARERYVSSYYFAVIYLSLGDADRAFEWLEKAYEERSGFMPFLNVEPMLDSIRTDSRFDDLLRRIGLKADDETVPERTIDKTSEARTAILFAATTDAKESGVQSSGRGANTQSASSGSEAQSPQGGTQNIKRGYLAALLLFLSAAGFSYWVFFNRSSNITQIESIAVMPFVNESGNADVEYLSDGMTETLISSLSQLPKLSVKARSSVFRYKGKDAKAQTVGTELNVQAILNGTVVQRGQNLALHIELVDVQTEIVLWSEDYKQPIANLVSLQSEIARDVSNKLRIKLSGAEEQRLKKIQTENTEAYQFYLLGRYHLNKLNDDGFRKGRDYFQQAIEKDPNYALAYAGLADAYNRLSGYNALPPNEGYPKARTAAAKALELDDQLAEAHATLGAVKHFYDWDWAGAEKEFKRAIEINANNVDARQYYSYHLSAMGHFDESLAEMKRAQELDPLSLEKIAGVGEILYLQRQYDRAIEQYRKALEMDSNSGFTHWAIGNVYVQKGMYKEAIAEYQKAIPLSGDSPDEPASLAYVYALSGRRQEALRIIDDLKERSQRNYISPTTIAIIYAGLGEKEQAFEWLEKAYRGRDSFLVLLKVEPMFDRFRSDPRFQDLVRRVGLPQ